MKTWNPIRSSRRLLAAAVSILGLTTITASTFAAVAGASPDGVYQLRKDVPVLRGQNSVLEPLMDAQPFTADIERIKSILMQVLPPGVTLPKGVSLPSVKLSLPMPEGGKYLRFTLEEVAIMHPDLAAKYPEIKTYRGRGLDDAGATLAFDVTPAGMHAQIRTGNGAIYIDPVYRGNNRIYVSYYKRNVFRNPERRVSSAKRWETPAAFRTASRAQCPHEFGHAVAHLSPGLRGEQHVYEFHR